MPLVGTIVNVHDSVDGSELVADAAATNTSITVADVDLDFNLDPEGGQLKIDDGANSEIWSYTIPEGSTGEIDLVGGGLAHSYVTGTRVEVYPQVIERWADIVEPDGENPLRCLVAHHLRPLIPLGPRNLDDGTAENVYCEMQDGDMVVQNVLGQTVTGLDLEAADFDTPPEEDRIRWRRQSDGATVADIVGYDDSGLQAVRLRSYHRDTNALTGIEANAEEVAAPGVFTASLVDVQAESGGGAANQWARVLIRNDAGGSQAKFLLRGDGTSDFLLDNAWTAWSPTFTGYSANPASGVYRYKQIGKLVHVAIRQPNNGTSNNVAKSISLPVTAATVAGMEWRGSCGAVDNGVALATPARARIASAGTVISLDKDFSGTDGWTASGGHRITGLELFYEAA